MSRRDPGAANGGPVREPGRCSCGHTEAIHALSNGHRTSCSASTCNCKHYEEVS